MTILAEIDSDCKSLRSYFNKLFEFLHQAQAEDRNAPVEALDAGATESLASHHTVSHLIKPDMIINIYSLFDYWMQKICTLHQRGKGLRLTYRDIRGDHDLHAYHKYLARYVEMDLDAVQSSYQRLNDLRRVRNRLVHHGGHIPDGEEERYSGINGITLQFETLIIIEEDFIWDMLDHTQNYLSAAAHF